MGEFKIFNYNKNWIWITMMIPLFYFLAIGTLGDGLCNLPNANISICFNLSQDDMYSSFAITTILFFCLFIYSFLRIFNYTIITSHGIEYRMAIPSVCLIKKSWREIKHYADVTETFSGRYRDEIIKAIWFIDYNDNVCLRLTKWGSFNFKKFVEKIDSYEDKFEIELEYKNPYLTMNGWKKVEYP